MRDGLGREIEYLRISITDRCPLRCRYCQPEGAKLVAHEELLTYEELLRVASAGVALGITRFKVTGGEPLVRRGCVDFVARLKALPGVEQVTITTNGLLLEGALEGLCAAGLDGLNLSLDAVDGALYRRITGCAENPVPRLLSLLEECTRRGLKVKVNAVLLPENRTELPALAALAERLPVDVRFIERMPLGPGGTAAGVSSAEALSHLGARWPDLRPTEERRGNGPARYFRSDSLIGRIGLIDAVSHPFCGQCNRVRLTSTGVLKPCLCYGSGTELRALLRGGAGDEALRRALAEAIWSKPAAHCFHAPENMTERRGMSAIGG